MDIRIALYFVIIIGGLIFEATKSKYSINQNRKLFLFLICVLLSVVSGFRHVDVGPDTYRYFIEFENVKFESWQNLLNRFYSTYVLGEDKDPGYRLLVKVFQIFSSDWQLFLITLAIFFFGALYNFLYNNTSKISDLVFALVLYVALFHIIALSGIRQQIATGFAFYSLSFLKSKQHLKFLLLIAIGSQIHISLLLMLILWVLNFLPPKILKYLYFVPFVTLPIIIGNARTILALMASFIENDYYMAYAESSGKEGSWFYVSLIIAVSISGIINYKRNLKTSNGKILYSSITLMTIFAPLTLVNAGLIRIGQYFSLYMMIFIPYVVKSIPVGNSYKKMILLILVFTLIFMSLRSPFEYYFFWESI